MSPRIGLVLRAAILVFALAVLALVLLASRPASAQTDPPLSGTWLVNDTTAWDRPVTLMGDLVVGPGGDLTLKDMQLSLWCFQKSEFGVNVKGGGRLVAENVVFSAKNSSIPYKFVINTDAAVVLRNCTIENVGNFGQTKDTWGVYVHSNFVTMSNCTVTRCNVGLLVHGLISPSITDCNISDNYDRGIWCMYSSPVIANNRFENNSYGIFLEESPGPVLVNNDLVNNRREALAMDANSSVDQWSIDRPTGWTGSTVFLRGNLTVRSGGSLALLDSTLLMGSDPGSRKAILLHPGGALALKNSLVGSAPGGGDRGFAFIATDGSNLSLESSAVHGAGYDSSVPVHAGPYIASEARINGSDLTGNLASLVCDGGRLLVTNTTLEGRWLDLWLGTGSVRMLNVSHDPENVSFQGQAGLVEVGWYLSVGVVWQNGRGVSGATLLVRDLAQNALFEGQPGPDGWVRWIEAIRYRIRGGQTTDSGALGLVANRTGFLDVSRQVEMTANREERLVFTDQAPPAVAVLSPSNGFGTNQDWVLLAGAASDDFGLDRVELRLDDSLRWQALSAGDWSYNLTNLSRGVHRVQVRATDLAGQQAFANLTLTVDLEPPRLELDEPFDTSVLTNASGVRFSGRTDADATLTIDGLPVPVDAGGNFDRVVAFAEGFHEVSIVARDRGGNTVTETRNITVDLTPPVIRVLSPPNNTRTRLEEVNLVGTVEPGSRFRLDGSTVALGPDGSFNVTVLLSGGPKEIELYAEDRAGNSNTTVWTLDRQLDQAAAQTAMQRYGLALALVAVLAAVVAAAVALVVVRRKKRPSPRPALLVDAPPGPRRL